jgi:tRNA A37 N6-isopentenylltransferase MiaA
MAQIARAAIHPLLAGGTMLYFRALRGGLDDLPPPIRRLRAKLEARGARRLAGHACAPARTRSGNRRTPEAERLASASSARWNCA